MVDSTIRLIKKSGEYHLQYRGWHQVKNRTGFWSWLFPKEDDIDWVAGEWYTVETIDLDKEEK